MLTVEGVVLKRINYKEHSKIIYLYTKSGLVSVLVHGSNKIASPYLRLTETLTYVKIITSGKNLQVLRDGEVLDDFREVKNEIVKYTYVMHMLEIIYYFATHDHDHEKLYNFLLKILEKVKDETEYIPYIYMFETKLLYLLGVNPEFNVCVECGRTDNLSFSVKAGGMCCEEHFQGKMKFAKSTIEALNFLYLYDLQNPSDFKLERNTIQDLRKLLDSYYEYHLNYRSNSRKMLIGLIGY